MKTKQKNNTQRSAAPWLGAILGLAGLLFGAALNPASAASRIKDIADFQGIRDNLLIGYGLVVGLNGTGDSLRNAPFTKQSLEAMLERLGVNTRDASLNTKNVAAVMVTASLRPFARVGTRMDVVVSTMGDSSNLQGGMLLVTPLLGADGEVYAVAQGPVAIGGFVAKGEAGTVTQGLPTGGRISNGSIIEREVPFDLASLETSSIALRNPDLTTARRVAQAVNAHFGRPVARAMDSTTIDLVPGEDFKGRMFDMMVEIEQLVVEPDQTARVVIDEASGIIVMGGGVRVNEVAVAQGNLTVRVTESEQVSQPGALASAGSTEKVDRSDIEIDDGSDKRLTMLKPGVNLRDLVDGLNALGVGPRDLIAILQTIKAAGALQAEILVQ
ncbi:MAG: flagellar basal body P-ring protein FlgI [Rhodospirillaceae bacterium]|nr:flagellar basal body P-ring protein FlgI [Rhodospirillaceae bacterium]